MQIELLEFQQFVCFDYWSQYPHRDCGAWEPGEPGLALSSHSAFTRSHLPAGYCSPSDWEIISLLIHTTMKQLKSNHRLSSHCCVSPGTVSQSIPFHTVGKIHLPVLSLIRHSSDWKSLLSKIKCWGLFLDTLHKKAVLHKDTHHALLYFIWKQSLHCIFLLLISVHYLIAPQNSEETILQLI